MHDRLQEFMAEPWWVIFSNFAESLTIELKKELSPSHILYGKNAVAVARRQDNDDVVYWINELNQYAIVHLTYTKENRSEYPKTQFFTLMELKKHCQEVSQLY
ncbi:hypothetical protein [Pseudoneobacillus rhizosphaerae]|jgi:hypothetical protein|uniref:Uncharacterized protein n=1 Tax=Pseudoneobacillus rhizosphaerae TaxID=2880968 RepID=A0A9C7G8E9_9BACI|nr:hypothetical protein [Pseudoneobacillus rhizosphaerae]CAG9607661.1 hypothetical protein NEOCIP111885_01353 [Pseudoneobacillus rhizosphaerae]